jgi:hypothetical protein
MRDVRRKGSAMARLKLLAACLGLVLVEPRLAGADPWKDESGNGRGEYRGDQWGDRRGGDSRDREARRDGWSWAPPSIPQGHMPSPQHRPVTWWPGALTAPVPARMASRAGADRLRPDDRDRWTTSAMF